MQPEQRPQDLGSGANQRYHEASKDTPPAQIETSSYDNTSRKKLSMK